MKPKKTWHKLDEKKPEPDQPIWYWHEHFIDPSKPSFQVGRYLKDFKPDCYWTEAEEPPDPPLIPKSGEYWIARHIGDSKHQVIKIHADKSVCWCFEDVKASNIADFTLIKKVEL